MSKFIWREITRNCHIATLDDTHVATIQRSQTLIGRRVLGWQIVVLGDKHDTFGQTFQHHDPQDLESTKLSAEARTKWAIEYLYKALREK